MPSRKSAETVPPLTGRGPGSDTLGSRNTDFRIGGNTRRHNNIRGGTHRHRNGNSHRLDR